MSRADRARFTQRSQIDDDLPFLASVPLFQRLPESEHAKLKACAQRVFFQTDEVIIKQGDQGNEFFIIKAGTADVDVDGVSVSVLKTGDYFGESALLQNEPRTATIRAMSSINALKITRQQFQELGLHEKLEFPKREKVTKRHKMMAAGAAGVNAKTKRDNFAGNAGYNPLPSQEGEDAGLQRGNTERRLASTSMPYTGARLPKAEPGDFWAVQGTALKEMLIDDKLACSVFLLVPIAQACKHWECGPGIIFTTNFMAIVPLASILGHSTEALSAHVGQLIGGLLNATFGNAVEMIMCVQAVRAGLIQVVQGNLLGSVLSNLLLVLGMAIVASGLVRKAQEFNAQGAAANMSCLLVASISVCLPTALASYGNMGDEEVLAVSRICSAFLISVYAMFLFFMMKTHHDLFADEEEEEEEEDQMAVSIATLMLLLCTVVVFLCSECLVDSIEGVSESYGLSQEFIGVILLPIVGNAAEHATAVTCAYKGMMDLALGVAVGSSTQIALFVVPIAVMFGWYFDKPMSLNFSFFDTTCLMLTVFLVSQVLQHGQTNWLHGTMLITVYLFIAVQTTFMHGVNESTS